MMKFYMIKWIIALFGLSMLFTILIFSFGNFISAIELESLGIKEVNCTDYVEKHCFVIISKGGFFGGTVEKRVRCSEYYDYWRFESGLSFNCGIYEINNYD